MNENGKGGWKPGQSGNPAGRPSGRQSFVDRAKYLMDEHTLGGIREIITDEKRLESLSVYDAIIVQRIAEAAAANGNQSMNSLLDRLLGKPQQYVEQKIEQTITVDITERKTLAETEAAAMLKIVAEKLQPAVH